MTPPIAGITLPGVHAVSASRPGGASTRTSSRAAAAWSAAYIAPKTDKTTSAYSLVTGRASASPSTHRTSRLSRLPTTKDAPKRPNTAPDAPAVAAGADAVLAASVFHFRQLTIGQVKAAMAAEGITVR